jgi:hypothetical protein
MKKILKKCGASIIYTITIAICLWIFFAGIFIMSKVVNYYSAEKTECNN